MLVCMRTTINLPDGLAEAARRRAHETRRTFTSLVEEGLRRVLGDEASPLAASLTTYGSGHGRVLIDLADREAVWEALDADGVR